MFCDLTKPWSYFINKQVDVILRKNTLRTMKVPWWPVSIGLPINSESTCSLTCSCIVLQKTCRPLFCENYANSFFFKGAVLCLLQILRHILHETGVNMYKVILSSYLGSSPVNQIQLWKILHTFVLLQIFITYILPEQVSVWKSQEILLFCGMCWILLKKKIGMRTKSFAILLKSHFGMGVLL